MLQVLVIDGQGGGIGKSLIEQMRKADLPVFITATGTNALATSAMLKAGADQGASGENAILFNLQNTDLVVGPLGILLANSILGEISPAIAAAVAGCQKPKILIPVAKCHAFIMGIQEKPMSQYIEEAITTIKSYL
mgnify:FL=1